MRPGPQAWRESPIPDTETRRPATGRTHGQPLEPLNDEQRRVIDLLQSHGTGMTVRQLQTRLSLPGEGVQSLLQSLLERQLVARLNTLVPSYVYRYEGVELDAE